MKYIQEVGRTAPNVYAFNSRHFATDEANNSGPEQKDPSANILMEQRREPCRNAGLRRTNSRKRASHGHRSGGLSLLPSDRYPVSDYDEDGEQAPSEPKLHFRKGVSPLSQNQTLSTDIGTGLSISGQVSPCRDECIQVLGLLVLQPGLRY